MGHKQQILRTPQESEYSALLALHTTCIQGLAHTYRPSELDAWIRYVQQEGAQRFARFSSLVSQDPNGAISAFISWSSAPQEASIECLYVLPSQESQGLGSQLLAAMERQCLATRYQVRSTLNAQRFYEAHGYVAQEKTFSRAGFPIVVMEKHVSQQGLPHGTATPEAVSL